MKKLILFLFMMLFGLYVLTACSSKKEYTQTEVFGGTQTIQIVEGDAFNLQDWFKDSDAFTYTTDEQIDSSKLGGKVIIVKATSKDGQVYTKGQYVEVISVETLYTEGNLTLQTGKKLDELAVKEGYKITYEGDVDYNKPGEYKVILHVTDPSGRQYDVERTVTIVEEPVQTISGGNGGTTQTSYSGNSDILNLAYSWEGRTGNCEDIAFQFQRALGYLQGNEYDQELRHYVRDFKTISSPYPGGTLVEYNNGSHVSVYLGDGLCLHGNYNGVAKVAACNIENITAYYDVATTSSSYDSIRGDSGGSSGGKSVEDMNAWTASQLTEEKKAERIAEADAAGYTVDMCPMTLDGMLAASQTMSDWCYEHNGGYWGTFN